jgi:transposase
MSKQRFEHKHEDTPKPTAESKPNTLQRVEIITGAGRRRRFSRDIKARIVLESRAPGAVVSEVARRHGLTPQQLFGWRRELRTAVAGSDVPSMATSTFTPVSIAGGSLVSARDQAATRARPMVGSGLIEIKIGEFTIRLRDGVAPGMIAAVLRVVRATS